MAVINTLLFTYQDENGRSLEGGVVGEIFRFEFKNVLQVGMLTLKTSGYEVLDVPKKKYNSGFIFKYRCF